MTCHASSVYHNRAGRRYPCNLAIDNNTRTNWASESGKGIGAWIYLDFGGYYNISLVKFMPSLYKFKQIKVEFSNNETMITSLPAVGSQFHEVRVSGWYANSMKITAISLNGPSYRHAYGFCEIQVMSCCGK